MSYLTNCSRSFCLLNARQCGIALERRAGPRVIPSLPSRRSKFARLYSTEPTPSPTPEQQTETSSTTQDSQEAPAPDPLKEKDAEISRLKDSLLLELANFQNLQKNAVREKANARDYAVTKFAEDLVSNMDVLRLALDSVPESSRTGSKSAVESDKSAELYLKELWSGVSMMTIELEKTLARNGITPFDPIGQKFDPNKHEALFQTPVPDKEPGTIFMTQRRGWNIKDRLLRPAEVGVVRQPES